MTDRRRRTAVVGSGVAGLTAAHILRTAQDVTLFEADDRVGGHAHTHELPGADGRVHRVDSGFIVHNRRTYPHLLRLFAELGVPTQESEMSTSVRCGGCGLEYAGARGPAGLLARPPARPRSAPPPIRACWPPCPGSTGPPGGCCAAADRTRTR